MEVFLDSNDLSASPHLWSSIVVSLDASEWFEVRDRALIEHRTQIDPEGLWFAVPLQFQREVWPTEDFQLARSLVDTNLPEDDLFAGIREDAR